MIVLLALLGIILARGFELISSRHFYAALLAWSVFVMLLQVVEEYRKREHL